MKRSKSTWLLWITAERAARSHRSAESSIKRPGRALRPNRESCNLQGVVLPFHRWLHDFSVSGSDSSVWECTRGLLYIKDGADWSPPKRGSGFRLCFQTQTCTVKVFFCDCISITVINVHHLLVLISWTRSIYNNWLISVNNVVRLQQRISEKTEDFIVATK